MVIPRRAAYARIASDWFAIEYFWWSVDIRTYSAARIRFLPSIVMRQFADMGARHLMSWGKTPVQARQLRYNNALLCRGCGETLAGTVRLHRSRAQRSRQNASIQTDAGEHCGRCHDVLFST